ncbi:gastrula zinc finger protein XlCGF26.1-like [Achroia grisella]|uniref:gastrula zinc finger protein XlCGF26.1-like n=1 Tax=Achroia grisella TaxID=688607 RepID=UPI0027D32847|nr:gastrula zinc finger protein XlCGF26.1-like [Achroia grisella]
MNEIWNLSSICRCCHSDGIFKNLDTPYIVENNVEIYSQMLDETIGLHISMPSIEVSKTICEKCIQKIRDAFYFKKQVITCEQKFEEYWKNEQALDQNMENVKIEWEAAECVNYDTGQESSHEHQEDNLYKMEIGIDDIKRVEKKLPNYLIKDETVSERSQKETARKNNTKGKKANKSMKFPILKKKGGARIADTNGEPCTHLCPLCPATYHTALALKAHMKEMKHNLIYKCEQCKQRFTTNFQLDRHMFSIHGDISPFKCKYCPKMFCLETSLLEHENLHNEQNLYQCDVCNTMLMSKGTLTRHMLRHLGRQRKYVCELCGGTFNDQCNLRNHVQTVHEKLKLYKCQVCSKAYAANKTLKIHMRLHTGERPYSCHICSKAFTSFSSCKSHMFSHDSNHKYKCKVCSDTFKTRGGFAKHTRTHVGMKPLICDLCGRDFTCKYSLKRHIFKHTGLKPFACDKCDGRFVQKSALHRHNKRRHSDTVRLATDKKQCSLCKRLVYDLEKHLEMHNNRPYICEYCNKTFPARNVLNRHISSIHLNVKSFDCQFCDRKYKRISALRCHNLKAHKMPLKTELEQNMDSVVTKYTITNKYRKKKICPNNLTVESSLIEQLDKS